MIKSLEKAFRNYFPKKYKFRQKYILATKDKYGIEIGGPSQIFSNNGLIPIYKKISILDGCNFSTTTIWEGKLEAGETYQYSKHKKPGTQFISEGSNLSSINSEKYDFLLSSHNLEHFANPLKALFEWKRILKKNGYLIMVLPFKEKTFDHKRPVTSIDHILEDYNLNIDERDNTHFDEILNLHDLSRDPGVKNKNELTERIKNNFTNRCAHHHVFDKNLAIKIVQTAGFNIINAGIMYHNIIILAQNN